MAGPNTFYEYNVNFGASIYHIVAFLIFAVIHAYYCITTYREYAAEITPAKMRRYIYVMIPLIFAMFLEATGYICRMLSHTNVAQLGPYVTQSILILVAPLFIQATIYMLFGELLKGLRAQHHSMISLSQFTRTFVIGDVISVITQTVGGGVSVFRLNAGNNIATVGIFIQVAFFATFMTCMTKFLINIRHERTMVSESLKQTHHKFGNWMHYMFVLFSASVLILVRSIYRVAEFLYGRDSILQKHEAYFYVLDSMMVIVAMMGLSSFNFPHYLAKVEFGFGRTTGNGYSHDLSSYQY